MNPNEEHEERLDELREARYRALGTRSPRCSVQGCLETDPLALTGAQSNIVCEEHLADRQDNPWTPDHHCSGRANSPVMVPVPANDHAVVSKVQSLWPRETLRNPKGSPLLRAAAAIRGWLEILRLTIDRTVGWVAPALEELDRLLTKRLGEGWWREIGWNP
jgi:hypothetical protein